MINEFNKVDYLDDLKSKSTFAYQDAVVFQKFLELMCLEPENIQEVLRQLMQERSIDTAVGKQLDIIGDIVGQPRELLNADFLPYFGYQGAFDVEPYGDTNDPSVGGFYFDINSSLTGNVLLNDDQYRIFIKAKIIKNITRATPEDIIKFITFVFGVAKVQITIDEYANRALILVSDDMNKFEVALLKYFFEGRYKSYFVPKALGVGYEYGGIPALNFFSFLGVPDGSGYGDYDPITDQGVNGGKYATIYT